MPMEKTAKPNRSSKVAVKSSWWATCPARPVAKKMTATITNVGTRVLRVSVLIGSCSSGRFCAERPNRVCLGVHVSHVDYLRACCKRLLLCGRQVLICPYLNDAANELTIYDDVLSHARASFLVIERAVRCSHVAGD